MRAAGPSAAHFGGVGTGVSLQFVTVCPQEHGFRGTVSFLEHNG